jgi:hypothetical protein
MPDLLTLIENIISTIIGISLFTYGTTWKNGKKYPAAINNNSLTLNLIVCRKRRLNPGRISPQKRKAQHKGKRIQRKKHARSKRREPG